MTEAKQSSLAALRAAMQAFADGSHRGASATERLVGLLDPGLVLPWMSELTYAAREHLMGSADVDEQALVDLIALALADWKKAKRWRVSIPPDVGPVKGRWLTTEGAARGAEVANSLHSARAIKGLAFGIHDGRLDLRGFVDPAPKGTNRELGSLDGVDFAGSVFRNLIARGARISNSRFDGASFGNGSPTWPPLTVESTSITSTSFRGADLGHVFVYGKSRWRRPFSFNHLDFSGANLGRASVHGVTIEDCDFANARLDDAQFSANLYRCRFAGLVEGMMIFGNDYLGSKSPRPVRVIDLDFSGARLRYCAFRWVDLSTIRLPARDDLLVVDNWPCVHGRLQREVETNPEASSFSLRFSLDHRTDWAVPPLWRHVIELDVLLENDSTDNVARLVDLLDRARAECDATGRTAT